MALLQLIVAPVEVMPVTVTPATLMHEGGGTIDTSSIPTP